MRKILFIITVLSLGACKEFTADHQGWYVVSNSRTGKCDHVGSKAYVKIESTENGEIDKVKVTTRRQGVKGDIKLFDWQRLSGETARLQVYSDPGDNLLLGWGVGTEESVNRKTRSGVKYGQAGTTFGAMVYIIPLAMHDSSLFELKVKGKNQLVLSYKKRTAALAAGVPWYSRGLDDSCLLTRL